MSSKAPTQLERKKCWDSRDKYFQCLETNNQDTSKCKETRYDYEGSCSSTWVKYFDRQHALKEFKDKVQQGLYIPGNETDPKEKQN